MVATGISSGCKVGDVLVSNNSGRVKAVWSATSSQRDETDDVVWSLYLGSVLLGKIDESTMEVYG